MLSFLVHRPIAVLMSCFGAVLLGIPEALGCQKNLTEMKPFTCRKG